MVEPSLHRPLLASEVPAWDFETEVAIVGFGAACEIAAARLAELSPRLAALRERLERGLTGMGAVIFGAQAPRLPNTSYFAFRGIHGETLVIELDKAGYAVGSGAACVGGATGLGGALNTVTVPLLSPCSLLPAGHGLLV